MGETSRSTGYVPPGRYRVTCTGSGYTYLSYVDEEEEHTYTCGACGGSASYEPVPIKRGED